MPTAGPSRRNKTSSSRQNGRSRRDADEDAIEEDPSQEQQNDDVDEEDEDGPHIRRRGTASNNVQQRRKGSLTANIIKSENGATDEAEVEEEEQRIDIENFEDQPLSRQDGNTIMRFGNEWEQMKAKARTGGIESISDVAAALADGGGDQAEGMIEEVDVMMRELLDLEIHMATHQDALNGLHQQIIRGQPVANALDVWGNDVKIKLAEYEKKTMRQKYGRNESYSQFKQRVFEVLHSGEAMPPVMDMLPREEGDDSDDEDDILVGGVVQDFRCPLTLTMLDDPYTSKTCKHSYSGAAIKQYLGQSTKPCPNSGCNKQISMHDLFQDKPLARRVRDAARRERLRAEEEAQDVEEGESIDVDD